MNLISKIFDFLTGRRRKKNATLISVFEDFHGPGGKYPVMAPKNLHDRIESLDGGKIRYRGSSGPASGDVVADEGSSVVVRDARDGWLRLWK